jgi:Ras-related protein Rab-1A
MHEIDRYANEHVNKLLIGNKCDMANQRAVSYESGKELADSYGMEFLETSAKNATNVEKSFYMMSVAIKNRMKTTVVANDSKKPQKLGGKQLQQSTGPCC